MIGDVCSYAHNNYPRQYGAVRGALLFIEYVTMATDSVQKVVAMVTYSIVKPDMGRSTLVLMALSALKHR